MKRKHLLSTLLFTTVAGIGYLTLSGYSGGPANNSQNRTGAKGSPTTCGGTGCHGGTSASTTVTITVDSTGNVPVTHYVPGMTYTIKITGTNSSNLSNFGFEYTAVSGIGASQVPAGTYASLPSGVGNDAFNGLNFVEHNQALAATTPGNYNVTFSWTAPAAGTGNVTMYCTLNAVNGNGSADGGDQSNNTSVTLTELVAASCGVVTNLAATATSTTSANATWTAPSGSVGAQYAINTTGVTPTTAQGSTTTTSHSFTGLTANTTYTVFVRDSCGPGNFSAWAQTTVHTPSLGINNIGFEGVAINAYPNPVMNSLNIKMENAVNGTYNVRMINITGQTVLNQAIVVNSSNFETSLNTASLANGTYALQISKDGALHTVAIVKH